MTQEQTTEFGTIKARLEEIAKAVENEELPLDDILDLYEEAVKLGLKASDLLEVGITAEETEALVKDGNIAEGE